MPPSQPPICIVDDDHLVQKTISVILQPAGYSVVAFRSGAEFLAAIEQSDTENETLYGCVLLDVKMPGMDGLEVLEAMVGRGLNVPVVMISGQGDIATAVQAMRSGAIDFVEKPFTPEQLLQKIELNFDAGIAKPSSAPPELANLSPRELEVLELLVEGDANKVIAYKLGISQRTVEVHRARIMERLEVRTFAELVRKAIAAGL